MAKKVITESEVMEQIIADMPPEYGTDDWDSYVMKQFKDEELRDGKPLCHGLRRITRKLLGATVFSGPTQVFPATEWDRPGRATVVYQVTLAWNDGTTRTFSDVADVWHGNTDDPFCAHPAATASTRAEARALRKALAIKAVSAEEMTSKDVSSIIKSSMPDSVKMEAPTTGESNPSDAITSPQKNFIDKLCIKLNVNVEKLAESIGKNLQQLTKETASQMITKLNKIQQDGINTISEEMIGYDENWKT